MISTRALPWIVLAAVLVLFFWHHPALPAEPAQPAEKLSRKTLRAANPATGNPVVIKLHEEPCADPATLAYLLLKGYLAHDVTFKEAAVFWEGRDWQACWMEYDAHAYVFTGEDQQMIRPPIPMRLFRDETM